MVEKFVMSSPGLEVSELVAGISRSSPEGCGGW